MDILFLDTLYARAAANALDAAEVAGFAAGRVAHARRVAFAAGVVALRDGPRDGAGAVRSRGGIVRTWDFSAAFATTGKTEGAWVELRAPGGEHRGWLHRSGIQ